MEILLFVTHFFGRWFAGVFLIAALMWRVGYLLHQKSPPS
jgi:hypothetical protein